MYKKIGKGLFAFFLFCLCLLPTVAMLPIGMNFFDEPFQIMNGYDAGHYPLAPLTSYLTFRLGNLFDWHLLDFRILSQFLNVLSILLGGFYFFKTTKSFRLFLVITSISLLCGTVFPNYNSLYGWDRWTTLFATLTIISVLGYISRYRFYLLVILGTLSSFLILFRLPNLTVVPICMLLIWLADKKHKCNINDRVRNISVYIGCTLSFLIILLIFLDYTPKEYYKTLIQQNRYEDHRILSMLRTYAFGCMRIGLFLILFYICYKIMRFFSSRKRLFITLTGDITLIFLITVVLFYFKTWDFVETLFFSIAIYFTIFIFIYKKSIFTEKENILKLFAVFLLSCSTFIGSNNSVSKFLVWPAIPIILTFIPIQQTKSLKDYLVILIVPLLIYGILRLPYKSFHDAGLFNTSYKFTEGRIKGIRTTKENGMLIQNIIDDVHKLNNTPTNIVILRNDVNFFWEYFYHSKNKYLENRFNLEENQLYNDFEYINWVGNQIEQKNSIVLIYNYNNSFNESKLCKFLNSTMQSRIDKPGYIIYMK